MCKRERHTITNIIKYREREILAWEVDIFHSGFKLNSRNSSANLLQFHIFQPHLQKRHLFFDLMLLLWSE